MKSYPLVNRYALNHNILRHFQLRALIKLFSEYSLHNNLTALGESIYFSIVDWVVNILVRRKGRRKDGWQGRAVNDLNSTGKLELHSLSFAYKLGEETKSLCS